LFFPNPALLLPVIYSKDAMEPAPADEAFDEGDPSNDEYSPIYPFDAVLRCPGAEPPYGKRKPKDSVHFSQVMFVHSWLVKFYCLSF
ncbi:MAG: hypothetical protein WC873_03080, partial [Candidatus Gracilibacteria bacterium]